MKILIARHGETTLNQQKKFYGSLDVPLDEKGRQQAETLANKIAAVPITRIITSGLIRAQETAAIVAKIDHKTISIHPDLNEKPFGRWEGLNANEIQAAFPQAWQNWLDNPLTVTPPDAEPFDHFRKRVVDCMQEILNTLQPSESVLIVAHQGVNRIINQLFFPDDDFWSVDFEAGSYTRYDIDSQNLVQVTRNL